MVVMGTPGPQIPGSLTGLGTHLSTPVSDAILAVS